jgi:ATP-dependent Clp protease ATP-binding subunit ClpA
MARLVQEKIKQPLAEELLFGKLVNGGEVKVRIKDNAPAFEIVPAAPKPSKTKPKAAKPKAAKKAADDATAAE